MGSGSRRKFLQTTLGAVGAATLPGVLSGKTAAKGRKLPVAGITTVYRKNSHSDVILGKILEGFNQDGGLGPDLELVSLYVDQLPENDLSRGLAKKHGFPITRSIDEAITLGGDKVAVAGVLSIGEHGKYPTIPETGQRKYPRKRLFDGIVAALKRGGRIVPVFNDKHLSYRTDEALEMYRVAKALKMPFMAGSSVPGMWRTPPLGLPRDCEFETAVGVGYGGLESYGFHALEGLQCMVERRHGGETGVKSVRAVTGKAALEAEAQGYWSRDVLEAAVHVQEAKPPANWSDWLKPDRPFYLIDYRDGLKACVAMLGGRDACRHFSFAAKLKGESKPVATWFTNQDGIPYRHFEWLGKAIEPMIHTGKPSYPVERTLLTTCVLDAALRSLARGQTTVETPHLDVRYSPADWPHAPGRPPPPRE